jgi:hypothetical protein
MAQLVQNAVGEKLYVWSKSQGMPSPDAGGRCIITSHGAQSMINSTFPINNKVKLIFYCPHGSNLLDPGTENIMKGEKQPTEVLDAGHSQDYVLSKYQKNGGGPRTETYDTIAKLGDRIAGLAQIWSNAMDDAAQKGDGDAFWQAALLLGKHTNWMDVVTIRNRPVKFDPTLSEVIKVLHNAGYRYTTIHCVFCRGPQLPWKSAPEFRPPNAP